MEEIPISALLAVLVFLIALSGFFSGSETALMTLNRYRLRHLARAGHRGAVRSSRLLERPDRLIGLILLGNNFVNILASSVATVIALRLIGEAGIAVAAGLLTIVILIFAEVAPKTLAALHPERLAFPASFLLGPLLRALYPIVWVINGIANTLLRPFGVSTEESLAQPLSREELRTVVMEAGAMIPQRHQKMLLNLLDLEKATVEDIMVPRNEIVGIDFEDDWEEIVEQIENTQYTRLPVYAGSIDNVRGVLHLRQILKLMIAERFTRKDLEQSLSEPYFIPEETPLNVQLLNFQRVQRRTGLVVDEYGEILGLVTLEDILEEVVGEFTTDPSASIREIHPQDDGSYLVDAGVSIRVLNRALNTKLPTHGPKTLNGQILEYLETIPEPGTSLLLSGYPVEIVQTKGNAVKTARIRPQLRRHRPARAGGT
ncbi:MAG: HlyC/CorC family transporter [Gammaproteobacteria bacterium]|nr:HlyC/CorC family transporter [Gammaproteobacteria bacterium]